MKRPHNMWTLHRPLSTSFKSYVRDCTNIINILAEMKELPPHMILHTLQVNIMYNISHSEGISTIEEIFAIHRQPYELPHNSYITKLLKVVLQNNYFDF